MAQQTLNNGVSGKVFRDILNQNFTDLYTNKAPLSNLLKLVGAIPFFTL